MGIIILVKVSLWGIKEKPHVVSTENQKKNLSWSRKAWKSMCTI
jgi:hypothetical protein